MRKVLFYSILLIVGLGLSQALPLLPIATHDLFATVVRVLTMTGLAFIMIHLGFGFHVEKNKLREYGWDYAVAFTAASFPWVFVTGYFIFVMLPAELWGEFETWRETLLAGRFAAPTSAGVLFSMLAVAGLGSTWVFRKARVHVIFDDLDTVLLMIPLRMLMVGVAWQLGIIVVLMALLLVAAYLYAHRLPMPVTWSWILVYSAVIVAISEMLYTGSKVIDPLVPIHIEVLLPAFVLGCLVRPKKARTGEGGEIAAQELRGVLRRHEERRAATVVSAVFMLSVGLSMPPIFFGPDAQHPVPSDAGLHAAAPAGAVDGRRETDAPTVTAAQPTMGWGTMGLHVLAITFLSNLGKMFPAFCYRKEAHWRHRLALAVGMWPRGEVGAGVLVLSLSYGIGGPVVTVAMLSLALNLVLTGVFILFVKRLFHSAPELPVSVEREGEAEAA